MLAHAEEVKQLVPVYGESQRQTGKTTALIEYAKEKGYAVVIWNKHHAKFLRDEFQYEHIFGQEDLKLKRGYGITNVVTDEKVDTGKVWQDGFYVVTGYRSIFAIN
ncbi:hypothetical protein F400_gp030 [Bacillus phage BCD7]|uniref:Uncharacterized protein n=1 Tax=Bacillus phage BCD7 TaxID=1136534 RepID=J9PUC6_9CAUD|nr:hypothetical protein F400_gp030 [Bacillus phage BCD7]AEZ50477.1 hypothetical protein BCD7_0030 [Bacillus phage BCD7]